MKLCSGFIALITTIVASPIHAQAIGNSAAMNALAPIGANPPFSQGLDKNAPKGDGNLTLGVWYSQADFASLSLGIDQSNFLSTDEELYFGLEASAYTQTIDISVTNPDFFDTPYARRLALSFYNIHPNLTQNGDYTFSGGETSIGFGRQITEATSISFGAGAGKFLITDNANLPDFISNYIDENGTENNAIFGFFNIAYDHTDDRINPKTGLRLSFSNEIGSAAGATYLKTEGSVSHYSHLFGSADLNVHGSLAHAASLNGGSFPILESYYAGGPGSLRGFAQNTLGPTSAIPNSDDRAYMGGKLRVLGGLEVSSTVARREDMHVLTFLDVGNVFGEVSDLNAADLRGSIGIGMRWDSPLGPLSLNVAQPMNTQLGDHTEQVQFILGASF